MLKIFIGYDSVEAAAYNTLCHSILANAKRPVSITPIVLDQLRHVYKRPRDPKQSNEFSFTRFLVPYLCNYQGYALFMDCDMMLRTDINEIMTKIHSNNAVSVVKHEHNPEEEFKYLGNKQYKYRRKNWSSVMLFNCEKCITLTPNYINEASAMDLHQFAWTRDNMIGELDQEWNHLVGYYPPNKNAKIVHYTIGGPWFDEYSNAEFNNEWLKYCHDMLYVKQLKPKISGVA